MSQPTSQDAERTRMAEKRVVYAPPGMDAVRVRRDIEFRGADGQPLAIDLYLPPAWEGGSRVPVVIIIAGYPDAGFRRMLGRPFKEIGSSVSWGRLIAASDIGAITYTNREPVADLGALVEHLRRHAAALGIDDTRIGVWASSGNVPLALSLLTSDAPASVTCGAFCYGYTLDLDGATGVADAAKMFGFANPCAGKTVDDLAAHAPLLIARAGRDQVPRLNESLDRFAARALSRNLPVTVVNHADGPHGFDLDHDSETTRGIIRQILGFLRQHLPAVPGAGERV